MGIGESERDEIMEEKLGNIPLDMFLELAFNSLFSKDTQFMMRSLGDVTDDMLRFIRGNVHSQAFRYLVEHGMTTEYCEQWLSLRQRETK